MEVLLVLSRPTFPERKQEGVMLRKKQLALGLAGIACGLWVLTRSGPDLAGDSSLDPPRAPDQHFFDQRAFPHGRIARDVWQAAQFASEELRAAARERYRDSDRSRPLPSLPPARAEGHPGSSSP